MGKIYDVEGPNIALRYVAILPAALIVIFLIMWFGDRKLTSYGKPATRPA
jgi:hypothetical protein